jgi:hypothetical protein
MVSNKFKQIGIASYLAAVLDFCNPLFELGRR